MTNYYTEVSTIVSLNKKQVKWALKLASALKEDDTRDKEMRGLIDQFCDLFSGEWFDGGTIVEHSAGDETGIWIRNDESCTPEHIAWYIQAILIKFNIEQPHVFEFGFTASRPIIGAFGGGACVVTKDETYWFNPTDMANELARKLTSGTSKRQRNKEI